MSQSHSREMRRQVRLDSGIKWRNLSKKPLTGSYSPLLLDSVLVMKNNIYILKNYLEMYHSMGYIFPPISSLSNRKKIQKIWKIYIIEIDGVKWKKKPNPVLLESVVKDDERAPNRSRRGWGSGGSRRHPMSRWKGTQSNFKAIVVVKRSFICVIWSFVNFAENAKFGPCGVAFHDKNEEEIRARRPFRERNSRKEKPIFDNKFGAICVDTIFFYKTDLLIFAHCK